MGQQAGLLYGVGSMSFNGTSKERDKYQIISHRKPTSVWHSTVLKGSCNEQAIDQYLFLRHFLYKTLVFTKAGDVRFLGSQ